MRSSEVVVLYPGSKVLVAFFRVDVVASVGPLVESSLDETFSSAVGAWSVRPSEVVANAEARGELGQRCLWRRQAAWK